MSRDDTWYDKVEVILKGEQRQAYSFGRRLGELVEKPRKFIDASLNCLARIPQDEGNPEALGSFLYGLPDKSLVSETMERIICDEKLVVYAVKITRYIEIFYFEHLQLQLFFPC